jgi:hypothetical protein
VLAIIGVVMIGKGLAGFQAVPQLPAPPVSP